MLPISTRLHAILDYFFSLFLMLAPAIFGFGEADMETIIPIIAGMTICFYSFFTRYPGGLYPVFPLRVHYLFDFAVAIFVATSPWVFGFRNFVYKPHLFIGFAFGLHTIFASWPLITSYKLRWQRHLLQMFRYS